jgi:hypothetical protein
MYRSDLDAAQARADALQVENERLRQTLATHPWQRPGFAPSVYTLPPSSGTSVLVWGVLSMLLCHLLGPVAWTMGNRELQRIDGGLVSPIGRGNVVAGRILGITATVIMVLALVAITALLASGPHRW